MVNEREYRKELGNKEKLTLDDPSSAKYLVSHLDHSSPTLALYGPLHLSQISSGMFLASTCTLFDRAQVQEPKKKKFCFLGTKKERVIHTCSKNDDIGFE